MSHKIKSTIGIAAVVVTAGIGLTACSGSSSSDPSPTATTTTSSSSPSPTTSSPTATPSPTFDGTVYKINETTRANIQGQKFASNSGVITVSSDNTKVHIFAEGSKGFTLDLVVNQRGQATSGTFRSNNGDSYSVDKGGAIEFGGLGNTVLIGSTKDIPVTPQGGNGSLNLSFNASGVKS